MVTMNWACIKTCTAKSMILHIVNELPGVGVDNPVGAAIHQFLLGLGPAASMKLHALVSDNGSDAIAAVTALFLLVSRDLGHDQLEAEYHVRCADHEIQLAILKVLKAVKDSISKLCESCITIRRSKVLWEEFRRGATHFMLSSTESTHQDSPARWNSTHEM
jgi:hypothetical protein